MARLMCSPLLGLLVLCAVACHAFVHDHWYNVPIHGQDGATLGSVYESTRHVFDVEDAQHAAYVEYHTSRRTTWTHPETNEIHYHVQTIQAPVRSVGHSKASKHQRSLDLACSSTEHCKTVESHARAQVARDPNLQIRILARSPRIHVPRNVPTWQGIPIGDIVVGSQAPPPGPERDAWTITIGYAHPVYMRGSTLMIAKLIVAANPTYTIVTMPTGVLEPQNMLYWPETHKPKIMQVYSTIIPRMYDTGQLESLNEFVYGWSATHGQRLNDDFPSQAQDECYRNGVWICTPFLLSSRSNYMNSTTLELLSIPLPPPFNATAYPMNLNNPAAPYEGVYGFGNWTAEILGMARGGVTNVFIAQECMTTPWLVAMLQDNYINLYTASGTSSGWRVQGFLDAVMKYFWPWILEAWKHDTTQYMVKNWVRWPTMLTRSECDLPSQVLGASTHFFGRKPEMKYSDSPGHVNSWQIWGWSNTTAQVSGNSTNAGNLAIMSRVIMAFLNDYTNPTYLNYFASTGQFPPSVSAWSKPPFAAMRAGVQTWIQNKGRPENYPHPQLSYQNQFEGFADPLNPFTRNISIVSQFFADWLLGGCLTPSNYNNVSRVRECLTIARDRAADAFELIALPDCLYPGDALYNAGDCSDTLLPTATAMPYWDPSKASVTCQVTDISQLSIQPYLDGVPYACPYLPNTAQAGQLAVTFAAFVIACMVGVGSVILYHRKKEAVVASSLAWSLICLTGCIIMAASAIVAVGAPSAVTCRSFWPIFTTGLVIVLGGLEVKAWRLTEIFNQRLWKTSNLTDMKLLPRFTVYHLINLFLVIMWLLTLPSDTTGVVQTSLLVDKIPATPSALFLTTQRTKACAAGVYGAAGTTIAVAVTVDSCDSGNPAINAVWFASIALLMIRLIWLAWKCLEIPDKFSESQTLVVNSSAVTVLSAILIAVMAFFTTTDSQRSILKILLALLNSFPFALIHFLPKLYFSIRAKTNASLQNTIAYNGTSMIGSSNGKPPGSAIPAIPSKGGDVARLHSSSYEGSHHKPPVIIVTAEVNKAPRSGTLAGVGSATTAATTPGLAAAAANGNNSNSDSPKASGSTDGAITVVRPAKTAWRNQD